MYVNPHPKGTKDQAYYIYIYTHVYLRLQEYLEGTRYAYMLISSHRCCLGQQSHVPMTLTKKGGVKTSSHEVNINCIGLTAKANWGSDGSIGSVETLENPQDMASLMDSNQAGI